MGNKNPEHHDGNVEDDAGAKLIHEVLQSIDEEKARALESEPSPRELPSVKTEYQEFCETTGGPIEIDGFEKINFKPCCRDFPRYKFAPLIRRWQKDKSTLDGARHWPALAFASSNYRFMQRAFVRYGKAKSPNDILELLSKIASASRELASSLNNLQSVSLEISDGVAPFASGHLQWVDQYLAQAASGINLTDVDRNPDVMAVSLLEKGEFLGRLFRLEASATVSKKRLDKDLLKRPSRTPENRALRKLVSVATPIWTSLSGKIPSTNKVHNKDRQEPAFVQFVQELADIGDGPAPSLKQVQTAFRSLRPPN